VSAAEAEDSEAFSSRDFEKVTSLLLSSSVVTDSGGTLAARFDYDPYGNSVVTDGKMNVDFGYTGHYFHARSGLNLTLYRAYNPALGRWISRDPIGEAGRVNLYGYVENNPVNSVDPLGLINRVWTAAETRKIFLNPAFTEATAGPVLGLMNILRKSQDRGIYDFSSNAQFKGDTFCVDGLALDPWEFGSYIAGYQAGAYDRYVPSPFSALNKVYAAGMFYHLTGQSYDRLTLQKNWNPVAGFPMITSGALAILRGQ
jgi:RHS repeat-associated protein